MGKDEQSGDGIASKAEEEEKGFAEGLYSTVWEEAITFTTPRVVHVKSKSLSGLYWLITAGIWVYVVISIFLNYEYLVKVDQSAIVSGWGEEGTMYNNTDTEVYCAAPYTDDFYYGSQWKYFNVGCARYPMTDIMMKRTPDFQFFTTANFERTYTTGKCSASATCNANTAECSTTSSSTSCRAHMIDDWCSCVEYKTLYVQGVEHMSLHLDHDSLVDFASGTHYQASSSSTKSGNTPMVTKLRAPNGTIIKTWQTPDSIDIEIETLLELAGVDLNTKNPDVVSKDPSAAGQTAYWRMTGVPLVMNMDYKNYDVSGEDGFLAWEHDDKIYCELTVEVTGTWASMGSESVSFPNGISYNQRAGTNSYDYDTTVVDRYRQGIQVVFMPHGSIGEIDSNAILTAVLNGVVLMGMATTITTLVGKHIYKCDGFGSIFKKYQDTECDPLKTLARSAAAAAFRVAQFDATLDPDRTGNLDIRVMYENLRMMFGKDLTKPQIALLVKDMIHHSDLEGDKMVAVDEFTNFISDDSCDLLNVVEHYKLLDENNMGAAEKGLTAEEFLKEIQEKRVPPELYERMKSLRAIRDQKPSALTKKQKKHIKKQKKAIEKEQKKQQKQADKYQQSVSDDEEKGQMGVNPIQMTTLEGSTVNEEQMRDQM